MAAVGVGLQVKVEVDHGLFIICANMLQAPQQQRVGIK